MRNCELKKFLHAEMRTELQHEALQILICMDASVLRPQTSITRDVALGQKRTYDHYIKQKDRSPKTDQVI